MAVEAGEVEEVEFHLRRPMGNLAIDLNMSILNVATRGKKIFKYPGRNQLLKENITRWRRLLFKREVAGLHGPDYCVLHMRKFATSGCEIVSIECHPNDTGLFRLLRLLLLLL